MGGFLRSMIGMVEIITRYSITIEVSFEHTFEIGETEARLGGNMFNKDTRIHLVEELEKLPPTPEILEIIREAQAGEYHDYKNKKYDCGKQAVYGKLKAIGLNDLAKRVAEGEFDEKPDDDDIAEMKKDFSADVWNAMFGADN